MRAYDNPAVNIAFVSGSLKQAQYSNNYMRAFFKSPKFDNMVNKITSESIMLSNGGEIVISPASEKAIRGFRADIVINDEICQMTEDLIFAALGCLQGAETSTSPKQRIFAGTPDNPTHYAADLWRRQEALSPSEREFYLLRIPVRPLFPGDYSIPWISDERYNQQVNAVRQGTITQGQFDVFVNALWSQLNDPVYDPATVRASIRDFPYNPHEHAVQRGIISIDVGVEHPTVACYSYVDSEGFHIVHYQETYGDDYNTIINHIFEDMEIYFDFPVSKYILVEAHFGSTYFMRQIRDKIQCRDDINIIPVSFSHKKEDKILLLKAMMQRGYFHLHTSNLVDDFDTSVKVGIDSIMNLHRTKSNLGSQGSIVKTNDDHHDATLFQVYVSNEFFPINSREQKEIEQAKTRSIDKMFDFGNDEENMQNIGQPEQEGMEIVSKPLFFPSASHSSEDNEDLIFWTDTFADFERAGTHTTDSKNKKRKKKP